MMSWSQRMVEARRRTMPNANSADSADRSDTMAIGAIGTIGTSPPIQAPEPVGKLSALLAARGLAAQPPCPADIAERAAIIAQGDHCDRATADVRSLAEHGLASWPALADAHRERILADLARLPPTSNDHGRRLLGLTRRFLDTEHSRTTVALGWDLVEVFGIHAHAPLASPDRRGLVPLLALSMRPGARLEWVEPACAVIRTSSGARRAYLVGMQAIDAAVLWWECVAITGNHDIQPS